MADNETVVCQLGLSAARMATATRERRASPTENAAQVGAAVAVDQGVAVPARSSAVAGKSSLLHASFAPG